MAKYLLDTNICISLLKDKYGIREKILDVSFEKCYVSEIMIAEVTHIYLGLYAISFALFSNLFRPFGTRASANSDICLLIAGKGYGTACTYTMR